MKTVLEEVSNGEGTRREGERERGGEGESWRKQLGGSEVDEIVKETEKKG